MGEGYGPDPFLSPIWRHMKRSLISARGPRVALAIAAVFAVTATSASATTSGPWKVKTSLPSPRGQLLTVASGGKLYAMGGVNAQNQQVVSNYAYTQATQKWVTRAPMPALRPYSSIVAAGSSIYVIGGLNAAFTGATTDEVYNTTTNTWTTIPMPQGRVHPGVAAVVIGGHNVIMVFGGYDPVSGDILNSVTSYDTVTQTWTAKNNLPAAGADQSAETVGGIVYILGGIDSALNGTTQVLAYDPAMDTYAAKAPMPVDFQGLFSTTVGSDGRIYAVAADKNGRTAPAYNTVTDTWSSVTPLLPQGKASAGVATLGNVVYVVGGYNPNIPQMASTTVTGLVTVAK
jgi:N-acetylneuraminic acid mutarotase